MAETLTPTLLPNNKRRVSISARLQSPTSPFFLGSNDDKLERAKARAARAAAVRRKPLDLINDPPLDSPSDASYLDSDQIIELFRNCIKLASENKINQKNTWDLKLIDHLSEIIKVEAEDDAETNFQKASCTLEAGVKIYALRVDSVHSEAYKVLGGISRAGLEDHQETPIDGGNGEENCVNQSKKEQERKLSPSSTLESSYDALNVKKFDVAFAVDPLYHQTTAQFDEGGAKGLLLNNLGVYGGCRVLFDSQEVPAKCISSASDEVSSNFIDISFAGEYIEQLVTNAKTKKEICPTFSAIVELLDECSLQLRKSHIGDELSFDENASLDNMAGCKGSPEYTSLVDGDNVEDAEFDDDSYDRAAAWSCDHNEESNVDETVFNVDEHNMHDHYEEGDPFVSNDSDMDDRFANVAPSLFGVTGISSSQNAWAGPDFWKYRRSKGAETVATRDNEMANTVKKTKSKKAPEVDLEFTESLKEGLPDLFAPPKNPKSLLLPSKKVPCSNKLPEDCHYQPEDLVKLFLLPHVMCLGKRRRRTTDNGSWKGGNDFDASFPDWDNGSTCSGQDNDVYAHSDVEEPDVLVSKPRQVTKVEVQYDKSAKQVDVHLLKETLWDHLNVSSTQQPKVVDEESISFKQILSTFPDDCGAAAPEDISPHLCFICLLHLANEHGLTIQGCTDLDDLSIHLPSSC